MNSPQKLKQHLNTKLRLDPLKKQRRMLNKVLVMLKKSPKMLKPVLALVKAKKIK
ncbi:hypothetical protein GH754_05985 [Salinibacillus xinjiangensis]|uniref:Uncharacterized protein n=1 Tax=Salinibacillus xinjiangensis TaxID=1229268 RepID=A0A6G1X4R0_9BACI|nr:hypothetical protein [Salinibacillus xinjiangensis]